jgi:hypothetical protein
MKKATYFLSAVLLVACFTQPASAQFEGKITYNSYEYSPEGSQEKQDEFTMYVTSDRILLQGEKKYDFMGSIQTEGVLVRLDFEDFVFLTGDEKALKISKADITSMMNMFDNGENASKEVADKGEDINFERTNESTTIRGYKCEKFIFRDEDNENEHTEVWMTKDLQMNWGMLAEPWSGSAEALISSFPMDLVFKEKYFPVKVDVFRNDKMISRLEATDINTSSIAKAIVQVPSGIQILSFQDFLFQKMSEQ